MARARRGNGDRAMTPSRPVASGLRLVIVVRHELVVAECQHREEDEAEERQPDGERRSLPEPLGQLDVGQNHENQVHNRDEQHQQHPLPRFFDYLQQDDHVVNGNQAFPSLAAHFLKHLVPRHEVQYDNREVD